MKLRWQGPKAVRCVVFCWPSPVAGRFGVIEEEGDEDDDPHIFVGGVVAGRAKAQDQRDTKRSCKLDCNLICS